MSSILHVLSSRVLPVIQARHAVFLGANAAILTSQVHLTDLYEWLALGGVGAHRECCDGQVERVIVRPLHGKSERPVTCDTRSKSSFDFCLPISTTIECDD